MTVSVVRTRAEALALDIEAEIGDRALAPGDLFGTIQDLRDQTKFARSTVSEAVRLLSDRGILEVRPGRGGGLFVASPSPVVRLRHMLLRVGSEAASVADAIAVREALEGLVDVEAARHRTAADSRDLRRMLNALETAANDDTDTWIRANWALHERIAVITPNRLLSVTYLGTTRYIADSSAHVHSDDQEREAYLAKRVALHAELVDAIAAGDEGRTAAAAAAHNAAD